MKVKRIMSTEPKFCNINTSLDKIASMMWEENCGAIGIVNDQNETVGLVTDRDIAMCCTLNHKAPWEIQASTVIGNRPLFTCSADDAIETALAMMQKEKIRRLLVVDNSSCMTGMLSIDDVVSNSTSGILTKGIPLDATMDTLKAVSFHH